MALVQKAFSDIITFSRSSNATRVGPTGLVEYAPHNLLLQSQTFNTTWLSDANRGSITADAAAAPDGTVTAEKLVAGSDNFGYRYQNLTIVNSTVYTASAYLKSSELTFGYIEVPGGNITYFSLSTGVVSSVGSGAAATITSVGNGWYRCSVTFTSNTTSGFVNLGAANASGSQAATNGSGIYIWGAQLAVGPYPLDYTPTTSAAVYGPRFDYDPVTLAAKGLLVEEQRTNLVTYSEQFDNAAWLKGSNFGGDPTVLANQVTAPDGTLTGDKVTLPAVSSATYFSLVYFPFTASATSYTGSFYLKGEVGGEQVYVMFTKDGVNYTRTLCTLTTSWQRFSLSATLTAGGDNFQIGVDLRDSSQSAKPAQTFYIWGAQLEAGSFATSYIPTLASTVTRSADVASVNTLSPWWNSTESTIYSEFDTFSTNDAFPYALGIKNNNEIGVYRIGSNGNVATLMFTSTVLQSNSTIATGTALNATIKAAYAIKANDLAGSANGGAAVTDTSATLPSVSAFYLGARDDGTGPLNGHLRRLAVYPRRLTNAELQVLSA